MIFANTICIWWLLLMCLTTSLDTADTVTLVKCMSISVMNQIVSLNTNSTLVYKVLITNIASKLSGYQIKTLILTCLRLLGFTRWFKKIVRLPDSSCFYWILSMLSEKFKTRKKLPVSTRNIVSNYHHQYPHKNTAIKFF